MTVYLLSYSHSPYGNNSSTGKKLAEDAEWKFITNLHGDFNRENDVLIRYGIYRYPGEDKKFKLVLNKAESIRLNINKSVTHLLLYHKGINVPRIAFLPGKIDFYPVVSRHKNHSKGKDIKIINSPEELENRDWKAFYFLELIPSEIEYRFHILRDKCIRISRKLPMTTRDYHDPVIRSFSRGWKLRDKTGWEHDRELESQAIEECKKALKVLELDFGAVDVVIEKETKIPYILEINTAPRLNRLGRKKYIKAFKKLLET